jgi:hypothetical protein
VLKTPSKNFEPFRIIIPFLWLNISQELRTAHHITIQVELHFAAGLQGLNFEAPQKGPTMPNVA